MSGVKRVANSVANKIKLVKKLKMDKDNNKERCFMLRKVKKGEICV